MNPENHIMPNPSGSSAVALNSSAAAILIEFVTTNRIWDFHPAVEAFYLGSNPEHSSKKNLPPDLLALTYDTSIVFLFGWRLELMVGPLVSGRSPASTPRNISAR